MTLLQRFLLDDELGGALGERRTTNLRDEGEEGDAEESDEEEDGDEWVHTSTELDLCAFLDGFLLEDVDMVGC